MFKFNKLFKINQFSRLISGGMFAGNKLGVSDLLLYSQMVDEGIILQTDGSFLTSFWYKGADLETSSDEELDFLSKQIDQALSLLGSGWMLHIDTIRHSAHDYIPENNSFFPTMVTKLIDAERRELYEQELSHYENSYIISFTYKPKEHIFARKINLTTSNKAKPLKVTFDYKVYLKQFKQSVSEIESLLMQHLNLIALGSQELLSYLSYCLSGELIKLAVPSQYGAFLKHFLASKDLVGGDTPMLGNKYLKVISVMGFPSQSYPSILDALNNQDFEYRFTTRFIVLDQYEANKRIDKIANLWHQKRVSAMDTLKLSLSIDSNLKINQNSEAKYQDAQDAQFLNDSGRGKFGYYTATIILYDEDLDRITKNSNNAVTLLRSLGFQSQIERYHVIEAYLGSLPGYSYANVRKWLINSLNLAHMMPNTSIWSGLLNNPCPMYVKDSPPLFYARTSGYTPIRLSLHVNDNGHTLIIGPSGSGKSTLLNFIIAQHFRYVNARVFVFDKNKSSLPLCYASDGVFYDLAHENNSTYFQPLAHLDSQSDFDFALLWLEELCLLNGMQGSFSHQHRISLSIALNLLKDATIERRTLSYFKHLIQSEDKQIASILDGFTTQSTSWMQGNSVNSGFVSKLFDANNDVLQQINNIFTVFEMAKVMEFGDRILIPLITYLLHSLIKQFSTAVPTLLIFDESFLFFNHEVFRGKVINLIKTARKFNVAIIFATQELQDLNNYPQLKSAILTNCSTKIYLANPAITNVEIKEQYVNIGLNDKQINLISNINRGDYLYTSSLGSKVFTLDLHSKSFAWNFIARTSISEINQAMLSNKRGEEFVKYWYELYQI